MHQIWREWTQSPYLVYGLQVMKLQDRLPSQVKALVGVQQHPEYHPEGDVFDHTMLVCFEMHQLLKEYDATSETRTNMCLAALCHDFGKAESTFFHPTKNKWVAYGHDLTGVPLTEAFLLSIDASQTTIDKLKTLTALHMVHARELSTLTDKAFHKVVRRLGTHATLGELVTLMQADSRGRGLSPAQRLRSATIDRIIDLGISHADTFGVCDLWTAILKSHTKVADNARCCRLHE